MGDNNQEKKNKLNRLEGYKKQGVGKSSLFFVLLPILVIIPFVFIYYFFGCPIREITGIPCPGCGFTRAVASSTMLDFDMAFYYHPLWFLAYPWLIILIVTGVKNTIKYKDYGVSRFNIEIMLGNALNNKPCMVFAILSFILLIGVYFYRLFFIGIP